MVLTVKIMAMVMMRKEHVGLGNWGLMVVAYSQRRELVEIAQKLRALKELKNPQFVPLFEAIRVWELGNEEQMF
jgi:hypothetical protein